jgi:hypothetical protein
MKIPACSTNDNNILSGHNLCFERTNFLRIHKVIFLNEPEYVKENNN